MFLSSIIFLGAHTTGRWSSGGPRRALPSRKGWIVLNWAYMGQPALNQNRKRLFYRVRTTQDYPWVIGVHGAAGRIPNLWACSPRADPVPRSPEFTRTPLFHHSAESLCWKRINVRIEIMVFRNSVVFLMQLGVLTAPQHLRKHGCQPYNFFCQIPTES